MFKSVYRASFAKKLSNSFVNISQTDCDDTNASFACLTLALRHLEVSVAYAVWAGLGIVLITLIGVALFHEPMTWWRTGCIALVLIGVVGLNLSHA